MTGCGAIDPATVEAWARDAEAGASIVYAWGDDFPRGMPAVAASRRLLAAGLVTATSRRSSNGRREYILQRLRRRLADDASGEMPDDEVRIDGVARAAVLRLLRSAAKANAPCPTNAEIARRLRFQTEEQASRIVCALRDSGTIAVAHVGFRRRRRVTIVSARISTALEIGE